MATAPGYDAFISYSHALDGKLAPTFQSMVERFAKPWYRPRALRVFRDTANLTANPDLWASIEDALTASRWLVLLASPTAARSSYVQQETEWWLTHKSADRLLIVLTGGDFALADGDAPSTAALPPTLRPVLAAEPRWVDLRWLRDTEHVSDANPRLRECVADVAAAVRGVPKDLLVGDHIRFHRRALRLARGAVAALALLTVIAVVAAVVAFTQRDEAQRQSENALFNQILTQADNLQSTDVSQAAELAVLAYRKDASSPDAYSALVARGNQTRSTPLTGHRDKIRTVAYDPRGAWVASGAEDHTLRIWNPNTGAATAVVELGDDAIANSLASSPDGKLLVAAFIDGTLRRWDLSDPGVPRPVGDPMPTSAEQVVAVALSPDGRTIAAGAADNKLHLWDVTDPAHPRLSDATVPGYRGVAFRPDGRVLVAGDSSNDSLGLWDMRDPLHPALLGTAVIGHKGQNVNTAAFSPDGRTLITGGTDRYAQFWNVADPAHPAVIGTSVVAGNSVNTAAVAPDDSGTVAIGSADQRIQLMNIADPTQPTYLDGDGSPAAPDGFVMAVAFAPDGHRLVTGYADGVLRLWDVPSHYGGIAAFRSVQLSPDGRTVAAAGDDGPIRVWRRDEPATPLVLSGHTDIVWRIAFSPDGRTLASASEDGTVRLWDLAAPQAPPRTVVADTSPIRDVAFSPDGGQLASAGQTVRIWDLADLGRAPRALPAREAAALAVAFAPQGLRLAVGYADAAVDLWDLTRPADPARPLDDHREAITDLAFSPDGRLLASTGADQTVRLWDLADPGRPPTVLRGHTDKVNSLAWSPDSRRLASGSDDRTVQLWNIDASGSATRVGSPLPLGPTSVGANAFVTGVAYAPDGHSLAIASSDATVRVWDLDADALARRICATAAHNVTAVTWQQYFRDQPFPGAPCG